GRGGGRGGRGGGGGARATRPRYSPDTREPAAGSSRRATQTGRLAAGCIRAPRRQAPPGTVMRHAPARRVTGAGSGRQVLRRQKRAAA
ncbi:MAG: hypothetical protein AAB262_08360, partial [Elusimicrobiota bacterium]